MTHKNKTTDNIFPILFIVVGIYLLFFIFRIPLPNPLTSDPADVTEIRKITQGMPIEEKAEAVCRFSNLVEMNPKAKMCEKIHPMKKEECYDFSKSEDIERYQQNHCSIVYEEAIDCSHYPTLCILGFNEFFGGDINYYNRYGYVLAQCEKGHRLVNWIRPQRCLYLNIASAGFDFERYMV